MTTRQQATNEMFRTLVASGLGCTFQYANGKFGFATYDSDMGREIREQIENGIGESAQINRGHYTEFKVFNVEWCNFMAAGEVTLA